jgi:hypothetical protein
LDVVFKTSERGVRNWVHTVMIARCMKPVTYFVR